MKALIFRFDIDTHKCISEGVPNLLKLANHHKVKFTFFINFGKSVDRTQSLMDIFKKKKKSIKSLPAVSKLGLTDYLYLLLFNPAIGEKYQKQIQTILANKHEVGIHGGKNHATWFNDANKWSKEKIETELKWAIEMLKKNTNKPAIGFASPGWNGSKKIYSVLREMGFTYVADDHSNKPKQIIKSENSLKRVPTNISGEPGGVAYIEHCRASNMEDEELLNDFKEKLKKRKKLAVIYDHPYNAGVKELKVLEQMIILGKSLNYKIITIKEYLNQ